MFWDFKPYRQTRKDTVLEEGIVSLDGTTGAYKVGDGVTPWAELVEFRPLQNGYVEMIELDGDPAVPAIDAGRIFMKDDGSGKTQLCVRFNTGAVQVLATEP